MERIVILGCAGAGKSTLARELGRVLGLPVIHLDRHFWNAGWVETPKAAWTDRVRALLRGTRWIMDGNYGGTLDLRLEAADTILFLDVPRPLCLARVLRRWWTWRGRTRPDLPEGCLEKVDLGFLRWIWNYPHRSRPLVLDAIDRHREGRRVEFFRHPPQVRRFLRACRSQARLSGR